MSSEPGLKKHDSHRCSPRYLRIMKIVNRIMTIRRMMMLMTIKMMIMRMMMMMTMMMMILMILFLPTPILSYCTFLSFLLPP